MNVITSDQEAHPAWGVGFGTPFVEGEDIGPLPIIQAEPYIACAEDPDHPDADPNGFYPYIENAEEMEGNIALVSRGSCQFATKARAAAEAGAAAVIIASDDNEVPNFGGECDPEVCSIPASAVTLNTGNILVTEAKFEAEVTIVPIDIAPPPPTSTVGTLNTGVVEFDVFEYGFLGAFVDFVGNGFIFNGENGLFVSTVLVGIDGNVVSNPYDGVPEWNSESEVTSITPPAPFDQGFTTSFSSDDLGVFVTERAYSRDDDPFVVVELEVENTTGSDISDAYIGLFADWDAGTTSVDDQAGVNTDLNLVYVYDPVEDVPYFGVTALGEGVSLSGYNTDATAGTDDELYEALTTEVEPGGDDAERGAASGVGPYDIPAGTSITVQFAYVAGADEDELFANAQAAQDLEVSVEETTPQGTYVLDSAYPNPFVSQAQIGFELPVAERVTLKVYDVLGREVATLVDGVAPAGPQSVEFDAANLPSGVYIYRLEAGSTQLVQRVTLVR